MDRGSRSRNGDLESGAGLADEGKVLILAALALLAGAVLLTSRWLLHQHDALGRARPFPAISTGLCLLVAAVCAVPPIRHAQLEHTLTAAARQVSGVPLRIHCETAGEAAVDPGPELGFVRFGADGRPERRAVLKWQPCRDLRSWIGEDRRGAMPGLGTAEAASDGLTREQIVAVHVLTHEAMHVAGTRSEADTECRAMQRDTAMARALGASDAYAHALARWYYAQVYPEMPEDYRTPGCAPGGSLDEHLPDPPWA